MTSRAKQLVFFLFIFDLAGKKMKPMASAVLCLSLPSKLGHIAALHSKLLYGLWKLGFLFCSAHWPVFSQWITALSGRWGLYSSCLAGDGDFSFEASKIWWGRDFVFLESFTNEATGHVRLPCVEFTCQFPTDSLKHQIPAVVLYQDKNGHCPYSPRFFSLWLLGILINMLVASSVAN